MEHLNYSRQLVRHCLIGLDTPNLHAEQRLKLSSVIDLHGASTKFILPNGGRLFDDKELRSLDESVPLRLPYPFIALEYHSSGIEREVNDPVGWVDGEPQFENYGSISAPKRVVYARERDGWIVVTIAFWTQCDGNWRILPECAIPIINYLNRKQISPSGRPGILTAFQQEGVPKSDYMDEIGSLLCFLNILQCSNVHIERSEPKKVGQKIKAALPFDTYHILTIGSNIVGCSGATGGHRSPREHLRRGHIRRLADGRRIWVNSSVISAGRGAGVISKDYAIAVSQH